MSVVSNIFCVGFFGIKDRILVLLKIIHGVVTRQEFSSFIHNKIHYREFNATYIKFRNPCCILLKMQEHAKVRKAHFSVFIRPNQLN